MEKSERIFEVEETADGSATIFIPEMNEHYHSVKGALTESQHIYRDCAFLHRCDGGRLRLLEVGFGTGLNATVTAMAAAVGRQVHYIGLEKYPVDSDLLARLDYGSIVDEKLFAAIHGAEWGEATVITPHFTLTKLQMDYTRDELPTEVDVVYFDAFAPEKQPDMWTEEAFRRLYDAMASGGVLTTYCAKGVVRRLLSAVGFEVYRIAGPVGGKREILRAIKPIVE